MKIQFFKYVMVIGLMTVLVSFDTPDEWYISGSCPKRYEMFVDQEAGIAGTQVMTIQSKRKLIIGYGSLVKTIQPYLYLNKRIRLTGFLKTKDVKVWTGLMVRVDQKDRKEPYAFDNMSERNIEGICFSPCSKSTQ